MQTVLIVIHLMIVSALIGVVLLQRSEGGGLGMGSGGGSGFMTGRGTANLLTRTTAFLALGFFLTSLVLSWLAGMDRKPASILDTQPAQSGQPATPVPPTSSGGQGGGALDLLRQQEQKQAPAGGPQVPRSQ